MQDTATPQPPGQERHRVFFGSWIATSHVCALWTFAVAQPILDLIGRQPDFLVAQRFSNAVAIGAAAAVVAPAVFLLRPGVRGLLPAASVVHFEPDPTIAHYSDHPSNLFAWLGSRGGYRVVAQETVSHLCPPAVCGESQPNPWRQLPGAADDLSVVYGHLLLPPALRTRLPSVSHTWTGFGADRSSPEVDRSPAAGGVLDQDVPSLVDDFLRRIDEGARRPTFYYLHLNLPHRPWKYLPSGREYTPAGTPASPPGFERLSQPNDERKTIHGLQRHLLQVGYADRVLGQVLDRLKGAGIYGRALIVVAADHGHSFRPGQRRRSPTAANVEDILEVPLFVKRPGQAEGATFDHLVQTIDVVPTIAVEIGARPPWPVDGKPLYNRSPREISVCCFREGDAVLDERSLVLLARTGDQVQVLYPPQPSGTFELTRDARGRDLLLRRPQGIAGAEPEAIPIESVGNGIVGSVDGWTPGKEQVRGWAADSERGERPREIVIYRNGKFLARFGPGEEQRDVAEHDNDPRPQVTTFRGPVPGDPDPGTFADRHRVFAIMLRGVAVELPYLAQSDPPQ